MSIVRFSISFHVHVSNAKDMGSFFSAEAEGEKVATLSHTLSLERKKFPRGSYRSVAWPPTVCLSLRLRRPCGERSSAKDFLSSSFLLPPHTAFLLS